MRPSEDDLRGLVGEWLRKADLDMAVAARLADDSDVFRDSIAFHSQQAVEKYLKALLVRRQIEFPKTHDDRVAALRDPAKASRGAGDEYCRRGC